MAEQRSGHVDTFCEGNLPPRELMPDRFWDAISYQLPMHRADGRTTRRIDDPHSHALSSENVVDVRKGASAELHTDACFKSDLDNRVHNLIVSKQR